MEKLEHAINLIERFYSYYKVDLKNSKRKLILIALASILVGFLKFSSHKSFEKFSWIEVYSIEIIFASIIMAMVLPIKLTSLIGKRLVNRMEGKIKQTIFYEALDKYPSDYNISLAGILPDEDLSALKLENGITRFAFGNDLIYGELNGLSFRLSEIHSKDFFFFKRFSGLVCAIPSTKKSALVQTELNKKGIIANEINNTLYLQIPSSHTLFEYNFKKDKINKKELLEDFHSFSKLIDAIYLISKNQIQ
ncbi:MAG: hypothetical protein K9H61_01640 [Bacteroidia bacterium]|nr:hypothetical protein [Bacteroidia bacterium]MCF8425625.1 hypothetical protein [Bacteroidia bacterium]MCF8445672.1 hypothetical protein [Bacteroidia bacterium]